MFDSNNCLSIVLEKRKHYKPQQRWKIYFFHYHNQKQIEPQSKGDLHISTRLGNVIAESNMVTIEGIRYEYKGSVHNLTKLNLKGQPEIRNSVENNRIIEELNNATIIDGLIEFDIDKF